MALSSDERERFLASLRTDPAFRDEIRREVLTTELLRLPERFAAFVEEMHAFVEATNRRFDALETDVQRVKDDSGQLRGMVLEQKIRMNPGYFLRHIVRRVRVVDLDDLLDDLGLTDVDDDAYLALARTDVLGVGLSRDSGARVVLLVEAKWRVHTGDIRRQVVRRQALVSRNVDTGAVIASIEEPADAVRRHGEADGIIFAHAAADHAA
jgi:hypothetical protein